ncbi:hypothetical protein ACI8AF_24375 [Blastococcus sp. SYSU D00669]
MGEDRSAALLVRVWLEDAADGFRARVTAIGRETPDEDRTIAVASTPGEVLDAVRQWLESFTNYETKAD